MSVKSDSAGRHAPPSTPSPPSARSTVSSVVRDGSSSRSRIVCSNERLGAAAELAQRLDRRLRGQLVGDEDRLAEGVRRLWRRRRVHRAVQPEDEPHCPAAATADVTRLIVIAVGCSCATRRSAERQRVVPAARAFTQREGGVVLVQRPRRLHRMDLSARPPKRRRRRAHARGALAARRLRRRAHCRGDGAHARLGAIHRADRRASSPPPRRPRRPRRPGSLPPSRVRREPQRAHLGGHPRFPRPLLLRLQRGGPRARRLARLRDEVESVVGRLTVRRAQLVAERDREEPPAIGGDDAERRHVRARRRRRALAGAHLAQQA